MSGIPTCTQCGIPADHFILTVSPDIDPTQQDLLFCSANCLRDYLDE